VVSSRLQLKAILVVLVAIVSLFVASARSPDAVFATILARAAAQDTHEATLRTTPSSSDGSDGRIALGLRAGIEAPKIVSSSSSSSSSSSQRSDQPGGAAGAPDLLVLVATPLQLRANILAPDHAFTPLDFAGTVDSKARARARLMVFLI
jgi:hypothetical protein